MTEHDLALVNLIEEASEVIEQLVAIQHRAAKALRFGMDEWQEGQPLSNRHRLAQEVQDFWFTAYQVLGAQAIPNDEEIKKREGKRDKYLALSRTLGRVD